MGFDPMSTGQNSSNFVLWEDWREQEPPAVRDLVDSALQRFDHDLEYQWRVHEALAVVTYEVACLLERHCPDVAFAKGQMMLEGETSPKECAERIMQMIPIFHMLIGSSFAFDLIDERRTTLEHYGMKDIDHWLAVAKEKIIGLLTSLGQG